MAWGQARTGAGVEVGPSPPPVETLWPPWLLQMEEGPFGPWPVSRDLCKTEQGWLARGWNMGHPVLPAGRKNVQNPLKKKFTSSPTSD